jgi:hypothetical protein
LIVSKAQDEFYQIKPVTANGVGDNKKLILSTNVPSLDTDMKGYHNS